MKTICLFLKINLISADSNSVGASAAEDSMYADDKGVFAGDIQTQLCRYQFRQVITFNPHKSWVSALVDALTENLNRESRGE